MIGEKRLSEYVKAFVANKTHIVGYGSVDRDRILCNEYYRETYNINSECMDNDEAIVGICDNIDSKHEDRVNMSISVADIKANHYTVHGKVDTFPSEIELLEYDTGMVIFNMNYYIDHNSTDVDISVKEAEQIMQAVINKRRT